MNLAVAFTEYQLLQVQAIARYFQLHDLSLIILDNNRIQPWLIDHELYEDIVVLPGIEKERWKRLLKSHIKDYKKILHEHLSDKQIQVFIGAQDENTLYTVIKKLASPTSYWNIEDGFANYYDRNFLYKLSIWLKKKLFKYVYSYHLPIAYAHGQVDCKKSFRIAPEISTGEKKHIQLAPILKRYLLDKVSHVRDQLSYLENFNESTLLVITDLAHFSEHNVDESSTTIYKFHPKDEVPDKIEVRYLQEKIPLEIIPIVLTDLQTIRFEVMSSSILNILCMDFDIKVEIAFKPESKEVREVLNFINEKFEKRIEYKV